MSTHALDVERRAKHELKQLLAGGQRQRELLGLITAAGGGLTLSDLEGLTGWPPYTIQDLLEGLFGRSVGSRIQSAAAGRDEESVYLFTHETLRHVAQQQFGGSLAAYRDRLHTWAESWRGRQWPPDTPQYLLRSYPRLLASTSDVARLVACATDSTRQDRMRGLTGGDAFAVAEISTAQQLIVAQPDPDLTSLVLLAVQREHLAVRNSNIPIELPAVWAMLGQTSRAEAIAKGLPDPAKRASALTQLARVAAASGDYDRAARLLDEVEPLAVQIADPVLRATVLAGLAGEMASGGNRERAEALLADITSMGLRAGVLTRLAQGAAAGGDHDQADLLIAEISDPGLRARGLAWLAEAAAAGGEHDRANRLASAAEALTTRAEPRTSAGQALTAQVTNSLRVELLARLARIATAAGNHDRTARLIDKAERLVEDLLGEGRRAGELGRLARTAAVIGDRDRAARLVDEVDRLTAEISDPSLRAHELTRLAEGLAVVGDHERAERLAAQISDPGLRAGALARLARAAAARGDHDKATALVTQISEPILRAETLGRLPGGVAAGRDLDEAEVLVAQLSAPDQRATALAWLAEAAAVGGNHDRATRLTAEVEALSQPVVMSALPVREMFNRLAEIWTRLAGVVAAGGDHDRAIRLINGAESILAHATEHSRWRAETYARLADAAAISGDHERVEAFTEQITDLGSREVVIGRLAEMVATGGDRDRAEALLARISDPSRRALALARVVAPLLESQETPPAREHVHGRSPEMIRARRLLAEALATSSWTELIDGLAHVDPPAVRTLADELQLRWGS